VDVIMVCLIAIAIAVGDAELALVHAYSQDLVREFMSP
jgi:hypothetical protein